MAITVNGAFSEFLSEVVNLDASDVGKAKTSRDYLIDNIIRFSGADNFFNIYSEHNLNYGSFTRHTKIQPLDDVDIMICFSAFNDNAARTYNDENEEIIINGIQFDADNDLLTASYHLNSTKVINRLISKLSEINNYSKAEMHKNHEAATLQLQSYSWNFDIVPCFYTDTGLYLIPNGTGNWKKTDPRIDNERTTEINRKHKGKVLDVIRLMKYWNNRKVTRRIDSYLLECMILSYYEEKQVSDNYWVDLEFRDLLNALSSAILNSVPDPKGIQGDLNTFSVFERNLISSALSEVYNKACEASSLELTGKDHKKSIAKWSEIFGSRFPSYSN